MPLFDAIIDQLSTNQPEIFWTKQIKWNLIQIMFWQEGNVTMMAGMLYEEVNGSNGWSSAWEIMRGSHVGDDDDYILLKK